MRDRLSGAAEVAGERIGDATESARRGARAAGVRAASAVEAAGALVGKPRLRGVLHQWAFPFACVAGMILFAVAGPGLPRVASGVYALALAALFGVSALYHRVDWRPAARSWMRRLDHSMIFVFIAATYTPFALLALQGTVSRVVLIALWALALAGVGISLLWPGAPKAVRAFVYVGVGLLAAAPLPELAAAVGLGGIALLACGGILYICGAVVYATGRPDPNPTVFGYHEVFHSLVIAAAACQFAAVAAFALPAGA